MKTLFITEWFMPDQGGSISIYNEVYNRYAPDDIHILTRTTQGWRDHDKKSKLKIHRLPRVIHPWLKPESLIFYFTFFVYALNLILFHRIKVIYCDQVLRAGLVAYCLNRLIRIPYVVYAHGEEINMRMKKNRQSMSRIYSHAAIVISNSHATQELLLQLNVPLDRIFVNHPGVDIKKFHPNCETNHIKKRHQLEGKKVILTVSRLEERKGHDTVLKVLFELVKHYQNLIYLIVGLGEEELKLKKLTAELGLSDHVIFVGKAAFEDLPSYYACCDFFIMPNRELANGHLEGFGIVFLEGAACGKAVIGGKSGGTEDAVLDGETGFLVDSKDKLKVLGKMQYLLENSEECKRLGENGLKRVKERFTWDRYYEDLMKVQTERLRL